MQSVLTEEMTRAIEAHFPRYPNRRAVVLPALHVVHERLGHVPPLAVIEIAELLEIAPAEVQDVLSFYGFFRQDRPVGQVRVWVCRSLTCAACQEEDLLEYLCSKLGIRPGQTTPDGCFSIEVAECLGACDYAPAMLGNNVLLKNMTRALIDQFLESHKPGNARQWQPADEDRELE
jgi:NADH-quinone oxidoreductase subunit E